MSAEMEVLRREEDQRLKNLANNLPNGMVYQLLADGQERRFLYVSEGVKTLFGVTPSEAIADAAALYSKILPHHLLSLATVEEQAIAALSPFFVEVEVSDGVGDPKWVQLSSAPRRNRYRQLVWDGFVIDITDRKRAELALAESERNLTLATEAAAIGIWHWDILTNSLAYSLRARQIYGFGLEEQITYERLRSLTLADDLEPAGQALRRALDPAVRSKEPHRYRIRRADTGEVRWVLAHGDAAFEERDGNVRAVSYVGTIQDVTEATRAEQALRDSESRLKLAIQASEMAVWEIDLVNNKLVASPELSRLYGFPPDAQPSIDELRARYAPGEQERVQRDGAAAVARGETQIQFEARHIWPDGTVKWLAVRAQLMLNSGKRPERALGVVSDVTERHLAEERLALVANELRHRVKNSLTVVQSLAAQTFRPNRPYDEAMRAFSGRLRALAAASDLAAGRDWGTIDVRDLVEQITSPYREGGNDRFDISGPSVALDSKAGVGVGMALHELSTNAVKYGSLSVPDGRVSVTWMRREAELDLRWRESGGPPVTPPTARGFGSKLLERGLFDPASGTATVEYLPGGVICRICLTLSEARQAHDTPSGNL